MNSYKTEKHSKTPLCSLETNIFKHKGTSKGDNQIDKANITITPYRSLLTREELDHLWVKYHTHGHFRDENSELIKEKSKNESKNGDKTDENFTSGSTQSIRIVSTNTWNWAQVTEINQSNRSLNKANPINFSNDTSDMNEFAKMLINQKWLEEKNTFNLSNTESKGFEYYNNNDVFDSGSEMLQPSQYESTNYQFDQDNFKKNVDPNIFSDFEYGHFDNQYDQYKEFDNFIHTIHDNRNELSSSAGALQEYFSL